MNLSTGAHNHAISHRPLGQLNEAFDWRRLLVGQRFAVE